MIPTLSALLVVSGVLLAVPSSGAPGSAGAQKTACLTEAPAATLSLTPEVASVTRESGAEYMDLGCKAYVVDVVVPAGVSRSGKFGRTFTLTAGDAALEPIGVSTSQLSPGGVPFEAARDADACTSFSEKVTVYKQGVAGFTPLVSYNRKGVWHPKTESTTADCTVGLAKGSDTWLHKFSPPVGGSDTYRIVAQSTMDGKPRRVKVAAEHTNDARVN